MICEIFHEYHITIYRPFQKELDAGLGGSLFWLADTADSLFWLADMAGESWDRQLFCEKYGIFQIYNTIKLLDFGFMLIWYNNLFNHIIYYIIH